MATIKAAVDDLLDCRLPVQAAMNAHFAPAFRQRVNGSWLDRAAFMDGIVQLRGVLGHASVTVLEELYEGARYAEHHRIDLAMRDGAVVSREVYVFAERDQQGRFVWIDEASIAATDGRAPSATGVDNLVDKH